MAYLIFTANGEEFDRRELTRAIVIGRAPDCDASVHDIVLSRHHCKIEPAANEGGEQAWTITDLHSKNGTFLRGQKIETHTLKDGEELRIGRTRLTFIAGAFVPGREIRKRAVMRAHDPVEALAGTISGMVICEPGESGVFPGLPSPKPRPADPSAYAREDVYGMISDIISSSWDSVMAQNSQPVRMQRAMPAAGVTKAVRGDMKPRPRVSFALQAEDRKRDEELVIVKPPPRRARKRRRWIYASATLLAAGMGFIIWQMMSSDASVNAAPARPALPIERVSIDADDAELAAESFVELDDAALCTDVGGE